MLYNTVITTSIDVTFVPLLLSYFAHADKKETISRRQYFLWLKLSYKNEFIHFRHQKGHSINFCYMDTTDRRVSSQVRNNKSAGVI